MSDQIDSPSGQLVAGRPQPSSEDRLRALLEHGMDYISLLAADGTLQWESPSQFRPLGYPPGAFVGRNIFELVHPDDAGWVRDAWEQILRVHGQQHSGVFRLRRSDGGWCWVEGGATNLLHDPSVGAIVVNYRDITGRMQAEEILRLQSAALNAAATAVVIADRDGVVVWMNEAFAQLSGYSSAEAIGRNLRDLVESGLEDSTSHNQTWDMLLAGQAWSGETIIRRKDGRLYPERQIITPVKNDGGEVTHVIAIKRDVTEEKQAAAQALQSQKMELVGRLAGGIAHDFNNLLTVINGVADFAMLGLRAGDPIRSEFEQIHEAGKRAASLTRQLLAFSRKQILMPVLLNLNDVVEDMRAMLPRLLGEHIALVVTPAKRLGTVLVDRGQIEQVILNLAVNARNAMPDGGTLTIETRDVEFRDAYTGEFRSAPPGHYVMLAVGDTGAGMDEATRTKIFEPFFTTKEQGRGTGLGLSTVDGIIGQSGGSIRVYSEPGHGTTFKVYLPRCEEQVCPNQPEPARAAMLGTETVLLVEDEVTIGLFASRLLRSAGYTVLTVGSAEEALALLEQPKQRVHLLLTDVVLPGMSGLKLATQIGPAHPEIKILYMSGYTDDATLRLSVRHQVTHFLGKPFTAAELMRKVREALDSPR